MSTRKDHPPKFAIRFLRWFCPPSLHEAIEGDLVEQFELDTEEVGYKRARRRLLWNVLKFFRPGILLRNEIRINKINGIMSQNHWHLALRHLQRRKSFAFLNILGLAIGLSAAMLVFQYVNFESSYDSFQSLNDRIFRVGVVNQQENQTGKSAFTFPALGPMTMELSQVEDYFRLVSWAGSYTIQTANNPDLIVREESAVFADPGFVTYFDLSFLIGSSSKALADPNHVIISEEAYHRYFGDLNINPVGQTLLVHNSNRDVALEFVIDGVFNTLPENSHLAYSVIFSHRSLPNFLPGEIPEDVRLTMFETSWGPQSWYTYLVLSETGDPSAAEQEINDLVKEKSNDKEQGKYVLQSIRDIHLDRTFNDEPTPTVNSELLTWLTIVGCMILMIAWVNYINLSTARAAERVKETGLRKLIGASKIQLIWQFLAEAWLMNVFAILLSVFILWSIWPYFQNLAGKQIPFDIASNFPFWKVVLAWFIIGSAGTALYPASLLASFSPLMLLRKQMDRKRRSGWFRSTLVVAQFASSLILLIGTMAIYRQVSFMRDQPLGVETERVLVIEAPNVVEEQISTQKAVSVFRNEVTKLPGVERVSSTSAIPGRSKTEFSKLMKKGDDPAQAMAMTDIRIDYEYFQTVGIHLLAGRNFSTNTESNRQSVILNETAASLLGFGSPQAAIGSLVGLQNAWGVQDFEVIGVVKNYHQKSLHENYEPIVFFNDMLGADVVVHLTADVRLQKTIADLRANWNSIFPGNPFDYYFLDDFFNRQYIVDYRFGGIFMAFAFLAIIISCLGMFGLSSHIVRRRTKEVSIRKIMGATMSQILTLLSFEFVRLILIASVVALPLSFWAVNIWLDTYAYKMPIRSGLFFLPVMVILIIALLTIAYQTLKASRTNPSDTLREE